MDTLNDNPFEEQSKHSVVFISHLPKGFEEKIIKSYFSQFGKILKCKISRHPQTLKSRHYGWILFEDEKVAETACTAMNNYILGDRVLNCKLLADSEVHDGLFKQYNMRKTKKRRVSDYKSKREIGTSTERKLKKIEKYEKLQSVYAVDLSTVITSLST